MAKEKKIRKKKQFKKIEYPLSMREKTSLHTLQRIYVS